MKTETNPNKKDALRKQRSQAFRELIDASGNIGKDLPVNNVKEVIESVKQKERATAKEKIEAVKEAAAKKLAEFKDKIKSEKTDKKAALREYLDAVNESSPELFTDGDNKFIREQIAALAPNDLPGALDVLQQIANRAELRNVSKSILNAIDVKTIQMQAGKRKAQTVSFEGEAYLETLKEMLGQFMSKATGMTGISDMEITRMQDLVESLITERDNVVFAGAAPSKALENRIEVAQNRLDKAMDKRNEFDLTLRQKMDAAQAKSQSLDMLESEQGQYQMIAFNDVSDLMNSNLEGMKDVLKVIEKTISDSKGKLKEQVRAEALRLQALKQDVVDATFVAGANKTTQQRLNQTKTTALNNAKRAMSEAMAKIWSYPKAWFFDPVLNSFNYLTKVIDVDSNQFEGRIWERLYRDGVQKAETEYVTRMRKARKDFQEKYKEIFSRTKTGEFFGLHDKDKKIESETGVFITLPDGTQEQQAMSKDSAQYVYALTKMKDARNKLIQMGWTNESFTQLEKFLGPKHKAMTDWVVDEFLPGLSGHYNEKHFELFRTTFGKIDGYFPLVYDQTAIPSDVNLGDVQFSMPFIAPGHVKSRVRNRNALDTTASFVNVLNGYLDSMEKFSAYGRVIKDLSALLSSKEFRNNLNAQAEDRFKFFKDAAMRAVGQKSRGEAALENQMSKFNLFETNLSLAQLSLNFYSHFKQLASFPAAYATAPQFFVKNIYLPGVGSLATTARLAATFNPVSIAMAHRFFMKNVPLYKDRIEGGAYGEEILDPVLSGRTAKGKILSDSRFTSLRSWLPSTLIKGAAVVDAITIAWAGKVIYDQVYTATKRATGSETAATNGAKAKFLSFMSTQQSSKNYDLGPAQDKKNLIGAFSRFKNSQMEYMRQSFGSIANMNQRYNREKAKSNRYKAMAKLLADPETARDMKRYAIYAHLMPAVWTWMGLGMAGLLVDWEEEDEGKIMSRALLGPLEGAIFLSDIVATAIYLSERSGARQKEGKNQYKLREDDLNIMPPAFSVGAKVAANSINASQEMYDTYMEFGEINQDAVKIIASEMVKPLTSFNFDAVDKIHDGIIQLSDDGELTKENVLMMMKAPTSIVERAEK